MEEKIAVNADTLSELGAKLDSIESLDDDDRAILFAAFRLASQALGEDDDVSGFASRGGRGGANPRNLQSALPSNVGGMSSRGFADVTVDTENWDVQWIAGT